MNEEKTTIITDHPVKVQNNTPMFGGKYPQLLILGVILLAIMFGYIAGSGGVNDDNDDSDDVRDGMSDILGDDDNDGNFDNDMDGNDDDFEGIQEPQPYVPLVPDSLPPDMADDVAPTVPPTPSGSSGNDSAASEERVLRYV